MKQKRTFVTLLLIIAILCLGIAYAAISDISLTISGEAKATADTENFKVRFTEAIETTKTNEGSTVTATKTDDRTATIDCSGLTTKDDTVTATYTIENASPELTADLTAEVTSTNSKFTVTQSWETNTMSVEAGKTTTITVTIKLNETVIGDDISEQVTVSLNAEPVQPTI